MTDFDALMTNMLEKAKEAFESQQKDRTISHIIELMRYTDSVDEAIKTYHQIKRKVDDGGY